MSGLSIHNMLRCKVSIPGFIVGETYEIRGFIRNDLIAVLSERVVFYVDPKYFEPVKTKKGKLKISDLLGE